jgi:hypothetical protein
MFADRNSLEHEPKQEIGRIRKGDHHLQADAHTERCMVA